MGKDASKRAVLFGFFVCIVLIFTSVACDWNCCKCEVLRFRENSVIRCFIYSSFLRLQALTDSESSDQHTDAKQDVKWLCKPRLNGFPKQDDVHVATQLIAKGGRRKRAVISSSSDEKAESDEERVFFCSFD